MTERVERISTAALMLAALGIAGSVVHREFFTTSKGTETQVAQPSVPTFSSTWKEALPIGVVIGDTNALMKVVVLSDLECPFCSRFHATMTKVRQAHRSEVALVFVHYPLGMH